MELVERAGPFRRTLLNWYAERRRDLPWRESVDFYRVWLSETMLQQTRVEAVIPYYQRFLLRFPTVHALAQATEESVLAEWSGLGYYSRARNMHTAARQMAAEGTPASYEQVRALPGVGPYTAGAVASIALALPHAAVDGNVMRVLSRLLADGAEIAAPPTRLRFTAIAEELVDRRRPGDFNQALMELGATVCVPRNPICGSCPVVKFCTARAAGLEQQLPVKKTRAATREVRLHLVVLERAGSVFLVQRTAAERRLAGFWELPAKESLPRVKAREKASFTHQIVNDRFRITVWSARTEQLPEGRWIPIAELNTLPVSTTAKKALQALGIRASIPSPSVGV